MSSDEPIERTYQADKPEHLKKALDAHKLWLESDGKSGAKFEAHRLLEDGRWADFSGADLRRAELGGVDLCHSNFVGADLREASLEDGILRGCNFRGADLRGACLYSCDLRGSNLIDADLRGVEVYECGEGLALKHARILPGWVCMREGLDGDYLDRDGTVQGVLEDQV
jgi:hypothetical protein